MACVFESKKPYNFITDWKTMRHLLLLAAIMGCITFAGCNPKPSPDTSQTKPDTSKTSKVNLDYFQDADFESTLKENAVVVVMFTADY